MGEEKNVNASVNSPDPFADFQQIDEHSNIFKQMFEHSVIPTLIHDMSMNILNANDSALKEFGYTRTELLQKSILDLHPKSELEVSAEVLKEMQQKEKLSVETRFLRKDGSVFFAEATPCKYLLGNKPVIHVFIKDITERKQAEQALKAYNQQLEIKNKELEQFAYIASHDLQEPLRTINSFASLFEKKYKGELDAQADKFLHYIAQASTRMSALVEGLLEYSRIGRNKKPALVNINALLKAIQADLHARISESKAIFHIAPLPPINGYENELRMLFQNLITNAIKFRRQGVAPVITIEAQQENTFWKFSIKDNGIGIADKHKERIFTIFQRLHNKGEYEGTGIGLAHCRKIAEMHNGKIWVESQPNEGSTFYVTLPS